MTAPSAAGRPLRIAVFGLLGSGNLGNHGSLDAMLAFIRRDHPEAQISCVCSGPEAFERQYGIPATAMTWYQAHGPGRSRLTTFGRKVFGKLADLVRTPLVLRHYDLIVVPGMGVLETTLDLNPWGFPYALFLMCLSARLLGVQVAFVSVGANFARERPVRFLFANAARLARYRSYRDTYSRDAMRQMGVDVSKDEVCPDLAFALPDPEPPLLRDSQPTIGLGVMEYHGTAADRAQASEIYTTYVAKTVEFARRIVDDGYRIRLVTGDPADEAVVDAIVEDLRRTRPELVDTMVIREPANSMGELMAQLAEVDLVVASRYHNVQAALKLSKPTVSVSYAVKNDILMEGMQLAEFRQPIRELDVTRLMDQVRALESRAGALEATMRVKNAEYVAQLERQFAVLSRRLFGAGHPVANGSE